MTRLFRQMVGLPVAVMQTAGGAQAAIPGASAAPIPTAGERQPPQPPGRQKQAHGDLSQWQMIRRQFARHRLASASLYVLIVMYLLAIFAEVLSPTVPGHRDLDFQYCPPQLVRFSFSEGFYVDAMQREVDPITLRRTYLERTGEHVPLSFFVHGQTYNWWGLFPCDIHLFGIDRGAAASMAGHTRPSFYVLGADRYGRDILTRAIYGARVSLSVGIIGITITFILGMTIGGVSGYVGGRIDNLIQRSIEVISAFPQLPLWLALGAIMPAYWSPLRVYFAITILLSLLNWTGLARVVRGKILSLREEDYAVAAQLLGASHKRVLFRHLLPGFASHIIVALSLSVPSMILAETSLSFLGLGLRPPIVSWGVMLQAAMDIQAVRYYPWLLAPVAFIIVTVLCFNFVGDGLRDAADPYASTA